MLKRIARSPGRPGKSKNEPTSSRESIPNATIQQVKEQMGHVGRELANMRAALRQRFTVEQGQEYFDTMIHCHGEFAVVVQEVIQQEATEKLEAATAKLEAAQRRGYYLCAPFALTDSRTAGSTSRHSSIACSKRLH